MFIFLLNEQTLSYSQLLNRFDRMSLFTNVVTIRLASSRTQEKSTKLTLNSIAVCSFARHCLCFIAQPAPLPFGFEFLPAFCSAEIFF